ncbi:MAG: alpha/beta hydrolase [Ilumatobacteraceae bacterium]
MLLAHELVGDERAPAVVLVHGITENHETWRPVIEALAADHCVLAVDLRGHGDSDDEPPYDPQGYASDVAETIAAVGLQRPLIVGHSLGGVVVTVVPAFCTDVVGVMNVDQPLQLAGFQTALKQIEPLLRGTPEQFREAIGMVFAGLVGPLAGDELSRVGALRQPDQDVVLGTWAAVLDSTPEELDALAPVMLAASAGVPYLALHGIDPGPEYEDWLRAHLPQLEYEVWPDHGHYPFLVDLPRFLDRLAAFEAEVRS